MIKDVETIKNIILQAKEKACAETCNEPDPDLVDQVKWPVSCTVGPGLEGAIASETKIGYVNGSKGWLIYRGYDIFDLCAYSTFEEVSFLLMHGYLPNKKELKKFKDSLIKYRKLNQTLRILMGFPVEEMNAMSALRLGTNMMRQEFTLVDKGDSRPSSSSAIYSDEDSIPMETPPKGEKKAIYEFKKGEAKKTPIEEACGLDACYHLISGISTITAAIARIFQNKLPIEPNAKLSHAGNLLYMMTGKVPNPVEERIMDICLILHADHGINASTFTAMVVASTLSDIYLSTGSAIAALSGRLHGGANEEVINMLKEIGSPDNVEQWLAEKMANKSKISGFGHRVYKAYDPRARILGALAYNFSTNDTESQNLFKTAAELEKQVMQNLSVNKKVFPNVDFYSGLIYKSLGIDSKLFTNIFAVARVSGWTARVFEYLKHNRIFRPRAIYTGEFNKEYKNINER
ncbi:MAG: citrate/2-methylcitrate synthase [Alphaproteobacteria bacterium]